MPSIFQHPNHLHIGIVLLRWLNDFVGRNSMSPPELSRDAPLLAKLSSGCKSTGSATSRQLFFDVFFPLSCSTLMIFERVSYLKLQLYTKRYVDTCIVQVEFGGGLDPSGLEWFLMFFFSAEWSLTQIKWLVKFAANDSFLFIIGKQGGNF